MGLGFPEKRMFPIQMSAGADTGTDPKADVGDGHLALVENGYWKRDGVLTKRNGFDRIASQSDPFLAKLGTKALTIGSVNLKVFDGTSFDTATGKMGFLDAAESPVGGSKQAVMVLPDIAKLGNIIVYSYTVARNGTWGGTVDWVPVVEVYDHTTGLLLSRTELANGTLTGSSTTCPHVKLVDGNDRIFALYVNSSSKLAYYTIDSTGSISLTETLSSLASVDGTNKAFDAAGTGEDKEFVACYPITGGDALVVCRDQDGVVTTATIAGTAIGVCGVFTWESGTCGVIVADGQDVLCGAYDADSTVHVTVASVFTAPQELLCVTGIKDPDDSTKAYIWTSNEDVSAVAYPTVSFAKVSHSGSTLSIDTAAAEFARGCRLFSRPFNSSPAAGSPSVVLHFESREQEYETGKNIIATQTGYAIMNRSKRLIGKFMFGRAGRYGPGNPDYPSGTTCGHVVNVVGIGTGTHAIPALRRTSVKANPWADKDVDADSEETLLARVTLTTSMPTTLHTVERQGLYIPNSCPYLFDGQEVYEQGFLTYPEGLSVVLAASGAVGLAAKSYSWCATYAWTDAYGNVHESAPSPAITRTPTANYKATVTIPCLHLSRKSNVQIILYRTQGDGNIFYRVKTAANSATADSVSIEDLGTLNATTGTTDDDLIGKPYLYTTGGVLDNIQPDGYRVHAIWQDRHLTADRSREDTVVWLSKAAVDRIGNERPFDHSDEMMIHVSPEGGAITALASFNGRLYIFKSDRVFEVFGEPPKDNGAQSTLTEPRLAFAGVGCLSQKSIAITPTMLMFQSSDGIQAIGVDGAIHNIGQPMRTYTDLSDVIATAVDPAKSIAVFFTNHATASALCYSYKFGRWSLWTNHTASDAMYCDGKIWHHNDSLSEVRKSSSDFLDDATPANAAVCMRVRTKWLSAGQIAGLLRVYRIFLLGQNIASHTIALKAAYNYDPYFIDSLSLSSASLDKFDLTFYFTGTFSSGYNEDAWFLKAEPSRKKLTSIMLEVSDSGNAGESQGVSLTAIALQVGVKAGSHAQLGSTRMVS